MDDAVIPRGEIVAPKYRQIPTKTPESYDFNEIPTDFGRMFWLLLPVCLDSEGRGQDNTQWLRSKLFPIREDDVSQKIGDIMDWLASRGMIVRYQVDGRNYFYSVNFKKYQTGTEKEAASFLPPPPSLDNATPDLLQSNSRVTPDLLRVNAIQCNTSQCSSDDDDNDIPETDYKPLEVAFVKATGLRIPIGGGRPTQAWVQDFREMLAEGVTPDDITAACSVHAEKKYAIKGPGSIRNSVRIVISGRNVKANGNGKKRILRGPDGNPIEVPL